MIPVKVTYTDFEPSEALTANIEDRSQKLELFFDNIQKCSVVVSRPHKHKKQKFYHIEVILKVPGKTLVVNREPEKNDAHHDPYICVRDAFEAMTRMLEDYAAKKRGNVKKHETHESHEPKSE
ncbi:MAG: HPF/RaiA family ribosome-associated protein [Pseudomonadota bacterium]|nr:HPF/RaiA family ribosome-associated protein [Pseudomonadota bacterium]